MIFSTPSAYAIRSLSELGARAGSGSLMLDDILDGTDLPRMFVAKLFQQLVKAGVLKSTKGRRGGFALARPAHSISLSEIVAAIDPGASPENCVLGMGKCDDTLPCAQHDLYKPIRQRLNDYLRTTTLADHVASLKSKPAWHRIRGSKESAGARKEPS